MLQIFFFLFAKISFPSVSQEMIEIMLLKVNN